jgi:hypothetical protein
MALTVTEKANSKERGSRGDRKKGKERTNISFSVFAITLTISTNIDFNINKSDKFYFKHVWEKIKKQGLCFKCLEYKYRKRDKNASYKDKKGLIIKKETAKLSAIDVKIIN